MSKPETTEVIAKRGRENLTNKFPNLSPAIEELEGSISEKYGPEKAFKMVNAMLGVGVEHRLDDGSVYYDRESRSQEALHEIVPDEVKHSTQAKNLVGVIVDYCKSFGGEQSILQEHLMLRLGAIEGNGIGIDADNKKAQKESLESIEAITTYRAAGFPIEAGFDKGGQENPESRYGIAMNMEFQAYKGPNSLDLNQDQTKIGKKGVKLYQDSTSIDYLETAIETYKDLAYQGFQPAVEAYSRSLTDLGKSYLKGDEEAGVYRNPAKAVSILKEAKEAGSEEAKEVLPQALSKLGTALFNGSDGVARDKRGAIAMLEEARDGGDKEAEAMLKKPSVRIAGMIHKVQDTFSGFKSSFSNMFKGGKSSNKYSPQTPVSSDLDDKEYAKTVSDTESIMSDDDLDMENHEIPKELMEDLHNIADSMKSSVGNSSLTKESLAKVATQNRKSDVGKSR